MDKVKPRQDCAPPGGFKEVYYSRVTPKSYFTGPVMFISYIGMSLASCVVYYITWKLRKREGIEMRSAENVIFPLLIAERDREYLKQLSRNRDEEEKLMEKVSGWEVGTWYGEPVFKTLPEDKLVQPFYKEFYAHTDYEDMRKRVNLKLWS